jgi:zinc protease
MKAGGSGLNVSQGLNPARTVLGNGVVSLAKRTPTTPAVAINLAMRAGSMCDPADAVGAIWLLSRTIDRGTATRSANEIGEALDDRGVTVNIAVTRHVVSLTCTCLSDDVEPVYELLGEMLVRPSLPPDELAVRKGEVITAIGQDDDNPAVRATESLMEMLYPDGHPYGRRTKGSVESVERLTRDRLLQLHGERFAPSQLTSVVVGDVDSGRAHDLASSVFGQWRRPAPPPVPLGVPPAIEVRRRRVIPMMNKFQAEIACGFTTLSRSDPAYDALRLMNNVLGQYSLGGRLGDSIRERQGMAYHVSSSFEPNVMPAPLVIRAGVAPANVDRTIRSIDEELTRLAERGVTARELDESRRYLIGSLPRALETNAAIATFLQMVEFFGLGLDYDVRMPDMMRAVTLEEVNAVARRLIDPGRAALAIAGPYQGV